MSVVPVVRVQDGNFGACLMLQTARVADCIAAMRGSSKLTRHRKTPDRGGRSRYYEDW